MSTQSKKFLRESAQKVFKRASVEGITRKKASKLIAKEILGTDPNFSFIDRAGRKWNLDKYFSMLGRTVYLNTQSHIYHQTLINEGTDLVKVSFNNTTCPLCKPYEGKILSLTGATKGYETYEQAFENGYKHPNCRHREFAYHPDLEEFLKEN